MDEGGVVALLDQSQIFEQTRLNTGNIFVNKNTIKNTFPVVIDTPLSMIQAFPNTDRKQANMINEMTGYFSEYGNLTIFVDTSVINNEKPCIDSSTNNCYVVPDSTTIESISTTINNDFVESTQKIKDDIQPAMPKPIEFITVPSLVSDVPEYIDIDALAFTPSFNRKPCFPKKKSTSTKLIPIEIKPITKTEVVEIPTSIKSVQDDVSDDDVIFVKEYHVGIPQKSNATSKVHQKAIVGGHARISPLNKIKLSPNKSKKGAFVPRRNPKRKAQIQKNYDVDFEFDFSVDNGEDENTQTTHSDVSSTRRSQRSVTQPAKSFSSTSSSSTSRSPIPSEYMREWPVDGMHERPTYNPVTGEIEKYDHVPKPKCKQPAPQPARAVRKAKRQVAHTDAKKKPLTARQKLLEAERINEEFAVLTHATFHDMIDYVKQFKRAHVLMEKNKQGSDSNDKFNTDLQMVKDILLDNSIFYCLANHVTQKDLAKYFVEGFKKSLNES